MERDRQPALRSLRGYVLLSLLLATDIKSLCFFYWNGICVLAFEGVGLISLGTDQAAGHVLHVCTVLQTNGRVDPSCQIFVL